MADQVVLPPEQGLTKGWQEVTQKIKDLEIFLADDHKDFVKWLKERPSKFKSLFKKSKTEDDHFESPPPLLKVTGEKTMEVEEIMKTLREFVGSGEQRVVAGRVEKFLTAVESAGNIVADAISSIFAPAPTCARVIFLFVTGFQRRQGVVEGLNTIIDKFVPFFQRVETRREAKESAAIQKLVVEQLSLFVDVCDYILRHRRNFWMAAADIVKLSFVEDSELKGYQGRMDRGLQNEELQSTSEIWAIVSKGEQRNNLSQWRKSIVGALDFGKDDLMDSESPHDRGLGKLYKDPAEGTCLWTQENNGAFARWASGATTEVDINDGLLVLEGPPSSGKSHAMAGLLSRLSKREAKGNIVAFCFGRDLLASASKNAGVEEVRGLVVRSIVWQFAFGSSNEVVRSIAGSISRLRDLYGNEWFRNNSLEQWGELLVCNPAREKMDKVVFVLIDGFESRMDAIAPLLEKAVFLGGHKLRIMVSSRPNGSGGGFFKFYPTIKIKDYSRDDIKTVIALRMESMPWSSGDDKSVTRAKDRILEDLPEKVGGDYARLDAFMQRIRDARGISDVNEALEGIDLPYKTQVESQLQSLAQTLTKDEILELNEMITWVNCGLRELTVPEMEAVLQQRHPVEFWTLDERIRRLGERIRRVYSGLFDISPAGSVIWRPMISDCIPMREEIQVAQDEDKDALKLIYEYLHRHLQLRNSNADPSEPQQLLRRRVRSRPVSPIGKRNTANAHLEIALTCLQACKSDKSGVGMLSYARMFLLDHLKKVSESLSALDKKQKQEAGPLFLDLFRDGNAIDAMFWFHGDMSVNRWDIGEGKELNEVRRRWLYTPEGVNLLRTLLRDPDWASRVEGDQYSSELYVVPQGQDTDTDNERVMLLGNVAKRIARHVFLKGESVTRGYATGVNFLSAFLYLVRLFSITQSHMSYLTGMRFWLPELDERSFRCSTVPDEAEWLSDDKEKLISHKQIKALDKWAEETLFPSQDASQTHDEYGKSMYNAQMGCVVQSFMMDREDSPNVQEVAKVFFTQAVDLDNGNTLACLHLSRYLEDKERTKRLELGRTDSHGEGEKKGDKRVMAYLLCELGNRYWEEGKESDARAAHDQSFKYDCTIFNAYKNVLQNYSNSGRPKHGDWESFVLFLVRIDNNKDGWKEYLDTMVWNVLVPFSGRTMALAVESELPGRPLLWSWNCIERLYNTVLELADKQGYFEIKFLAHQSFASTLSFAVSRDRGNEKAILNLEKAMEFAKELRKVRGEEAKPLLRISDWRISRAAEQLARLYLHRLLVLKSLPNPQQEHQSTVESIGEKFHAHVTEHNAHQENTALSCYLARWRKAEGKSEGEQVNAVKHVVEEAEAMLLDDIPTNDQQAWESLFQVAVTMNDLESAKTIWRLLYEFHSVPRDSSMATALGETGYVCDICGKGICIEQEVYICQDCAGEATFHEGCHTAYPKPERLCDRHELVRISSSGNVSLDVVGVSETYIWSRIAHVYQLQVEKMKEVERLRGSSMKEEMKKVMDTEMKGDMEEDSDLEVAIAREEARVMEERFRARERELEDRDLRYMPVSGGKDRSERMEDLGEILG